MWATPLPPDAWSDTMTAGGLPAVCLALAGGLLAHSTGRLPGKRRHVPERLLIIGTGRLAQRLVREIEARPHCRCVVIGAVDDETADDKASFPCAVLGTLDRLDRIITAVRPDRIVIAVTERRGRLPVQELLESRVDGILVENAAEAYEHLTGKLAIEELTPSNLVFSKHFGKSRVTAAVGRGISLLASVAGLIGLAPLFGLIALVIKLDSPGPVFFVQQRVGQFGRTFNLIKFRTMRPASRHTSEWAKDNGDRITAVGRWLRKFRLDELPQFVNVLRGDMNLVGPRPHPASNLDLLVLVSRNAPECGLAIPYYSLRSMVPPGITGWAQVRYRYANDLEEEIEKLRYDLYYIKHRSVWLDLRILLETVKIVLMGHGTGVDAAARTEPPARASKPDEFAKTA